MALARKSGKGWMSKNTQHQRRPWEETPEEYGSRLKACAAYINEHHNVDKLCRGLPARLHELNRLKGDRLGH